MNLDEKMVFFGDFRKHTTFNAFIRAENLFTRSDDYQKRNWVYRIYCQKWHMAHPSLKQTLLPHFEMKAEDCLYLHVHTDPYEENLDTSAARQNHLRKLLDPKAAMIAQLRRDILGNPELTEATGASVTSLSAADDVKTLCAVKFSAGLRPGMSSLECSESVVNLISAVLPILKKAIDENQPA